MFIFGDTTIIEAKHEVYPRKQLSLPVAELQINLECLK